jgi:hypothetical protein
MNHRLNSSLTFFLLISLVTVGFGQNKNTNDYGIYESLNMGLAYNYSFGETNKKDFHLLYIGVIST